MIEVVAIVDIGKLREVNDDRLLINKLVWDEGKTRIFLNEDINILAVADGVGGSPAGGIAAEITLSTIAETKNISEAIQQANKNVCEFSKENPEASGLATTLSGVITDKDKITVFNIGDSRVYRHRQGILSLLTKDHSLMGFSSTITRCVGGFESICIPDIEEISFLDDDILLICSDGLSDYVQRDAISNTLMQNDLNTAADELVKMANNAGGYDNISVLLAKKGEI